MKTKILLLAAGILLATLPARAQTFSFVMQTDTIVCGNPGDVIYVYANVTNTTATSQSLDMIRVENNIPANWETTICIDVCYQPWVDSAQVSFGANETKIFIFHFYTDISAPDSGNARVIFRTVSNPAEVISQRLYGKTNCVLGVGDIANSDLKLSLYPNPASSFSAITFSLPYPDVVTVSIYDLAGKRIADVGSSQKSAGSHSVPFDAGALAPSTYLLKLQTTRFSQTRKIILTK